MVDYYQIRQLSSEQKVTFVCGESINSAIGFLEYADKGYIVDILIIEQGLRTLLGEEQKSDLIEIFKNNHDLSSLECIKIWKESILNA